jgi:hypothetical protein
MSSHPRLKFPTLKRQAESYFCNGYERSMADSGDDTDRHEDVRVWRLYYRRMRILQAAMALLVYLLFTHFTCQPLTGS